MAYMYRIEIIGAYDADGRVVDGDYDPGNYGLDVNARYATYEAAEGAARASYLGPDPYGVGIRWCIGR